MSRSHKFPFGVPSGTWQDLSHHKGQRQIVHVFGQKIILFLRPIEKNLEEKRAGRRSDAGPGGLLKGLDDGVVAGN